MRGQITEKTSFSLGKEATIVGRSAGSDHDLPSAVAEEVGDRKRAGMRDEKNEPTIEEESEERPHSQTGIWEVEDESGKRSILYNVGSDDDAQGRREIEQEKLDRAWEMLRNMIIDARESE